MTCGVRFCVMCECRAARAAQGRSQKAVPEARRREMHERFCIPNGGGCRGLGASALQPCSENAGTKETIRLHAPVQNGQTKGGRRRVHWLQLWNPAFVWSLGVLIPIRVLKRTNSGKSVVCASEMPQAEDSPMVARACRQGGLPLKDAALQRIARSLCPKPLRCTGLARAQEQRASGARTWPAGPRRRITSTWLKPCMPNVPNGAK